MSAIANRLKKNWDKLKPWASKLDIEAFRLYDRDIPEYPSIIEIFGNHAVLWDRRDDQIDRTKEQNFDDTIAAIAALGIPHSHIVVKRRQRQQPRAKIIPGLDTPMPVEGAGNVLGVEDAEGEMVDRAEDDRMDYDGDDGESQSETLSQAESAAPKAGATVGSPREPVIINTTSNRSPLAAPPRGVGRQYGRLSRNSQELSVREGQHKFLVNLHDYLDTGLFLDHRLTRKIVADHIQKRTAGQLKTRFLNLFCYTGSFSVYAARAGATVTSVDMSPVYLAWAERNFIGNGLMTSNHRFINEDVLAWTKSGEARRTGPYEFIFCDPPTFSNSKKMEGTWEVQRDHAWLIEQCLDSLTPDGVLIFSANRRDFVLDESFQDMDDYKVRELTRDTLPKDFHDAKARRVYLFS